jgi:hypothetical protein
MSRITHIRITLKDAHGNTVDGGIYPATEAAKRIADFVVLHGTDPDALGKHAQQGSVQFSPVLPRPITRTGTSP